MASAPIRPGDRYTLGKLTPRGHDDMARVTGWQILVAYSDSTGRPLSALCPPNEDEIVAWLNRDTAGRYRLAELAGVLE